MFAATVSNKHLLWYHETSRRYATLTPLASRGNIPAGLAMTPVLIKSSLQPWYRVHRGPSHNSV